MQVPKNNHPKDKINYRKKLQMIKALFEYHFLQNAVAGAILASIACGIIGTLIIEKKLLMMSGGIAHTAFGGVGMGYFLKIEPMIGALIFAVGSALGIATINRKVHTHTDILIGLFWSIGMATGILFIAFTPGYPPDMTSYLFGNILTVVKFDLQIMLALDVIILLAVIAFFQHLKAYLFDEEFAVLLGIKVTFLEYLLFLLIAFTVVVLIRVVGIILVIALLTAPPAIAKQFTHDLKKIMMGSIGLGILFCLCGLWISYDLRIASGATIILFSGISYLAVSLVKKIIHRSKQPF
jgi:zinc transport system permease protein